jgi:iron(III) transport system permease protein
MVPIFLNTVFFTVGSLAVGLPLAILLAWLLERTAVPGRRWFANLILVPMTIPSLLSAIAWIQLLDPRVGLINVVLRGAFGMSADTGPLDIYSLYGMCFVQGLRLVPSAYLMIAATFRAMDPSLEEQSAMAGRGVAQTTLRVTLPIMRPALLAALIYFIIVVIESFDIPGLLGFTARIRVLSSPSHCFSCGFINDSRRIKSVSLPSRARGTGHVKSNSAAGPVWRRLSA